MTCTPWYKSMIHQTALGKNSSHTNSDRANRQSWAGLLEWEDRSATVKTTRMVSSLFNRERLTKPVWTCHGFKQCAHRSKRPVIVPSVLPQARFPLSCQTPTRFPLFSSSLDDPVVQQCHPSESSAYGPVSMMISLSTDEMMRKRTDTVDLRRASAN